MFKLVFLVISISMSMVVHAEWSKPLRIAQLKVQSNGVNVKLVGFESSEVECGDNRSFFLTKSDGGNYDVKVSFLLGAYLSRTPVDISFYKCNTEYPTHLEVGSIQFREE